MRSYCDKGSFVLIAAGIVATSLSGRASAAPEDRATAAGDDESPAAVKGNRTAARPTSGPATAPAQWEPGITVEQLPSGAYPEASDGGIFGSSTTWGKPTRGIWGGSLWRTFHGLQWPYMPKTGVGVSGSVWVDTGYEQIARPHDGQRTDRTFYLQQGRAVLRLTPTYSNGSLFIQGQVELVGNKDQASNPPLATTDDLWVRVGEWNRWDLQLGRFESWEVYHLGMGLDLNTLERNGATDFGQYNDQAPLYLVRFSPETRESGVGYVAAHVYPTGFLRLELLGLAGNDNNGFNTLGTRPAAIVDLGMVKLNVAGEYIRRRGRDNYNDPASMTQVESRNTVFQRGFGGGIQFVFDPIFEAGFNVAKGVQDATKQDNTGNPDLAASFDILSIGGFANVRLGGDWIVGAGADLTKKDDLNVLGAADGTLKAGSFQQLQAFAALQYVVAKRLFVKAVGGYARATFSPGGVTSEVANNMYSGRVRFEYLF